MNVIIYICLEDLISNVIFYAVSCILLFVLRSQALSFIYIYISIYMFDIIRNFLN